ncbi:hypothetical protein [Ruegeria arenilitoris]|uniref:hypothetical protein n=1 Tax=Ruegeria arenilitoris TaxID=1173585 RepID=UPI001C93D2AD|nr:hypothetical protein [Ruegeria arenilitoris]MBY6081844.1 hypothetical protein [Ruegeria arenilitoris]
MLEHIMDANLKLKRPIIVVAGPMDENSGGTIIFYKLVDSLRQIGVEAYIYPRGIKRNFDDISLLKKHLKFGYKHFKKAIIPRKKYSHPSMNTPLAPFSAFWRRPIVVYSEYEAGNPLGASAIVRWASGLTAMRAGRELKVFPESEEIFYFTRSHVNDGTDKATKNELHVEWIRDDIYHNKNLAHRSGTCRMRRKAKLYGIGEDVNDGESLLLDGLSHEEIAQAFNEREFFYCDDPYTLYCKYAVMCGCIVVVTPIPGVSEVDWIPQRDRWGMAYGDAPEQIEFARSTLHRMKETIEVTREAEKQQMLYFVDRISKRFE